MFFAVVAKGDSALAGEERKELKETNGETGSKEEKTTSIWVYTSENHGTSIEVPLTPDTKVTDVLDCVRDPVRGNGYLVAVAGDTEYILQDEDNAFSFLHHIWTSSGLPLTFLLRYYNQDVAWPPPDLEARRHQMRRPQNVQDGTPSASSGKLPGGPGDLTLAELQEMAGRQQQQMEAQQQVLVAKEQRLKYLKQQEARHAQLASESERLRRIRERVESQELKLKKLRALRGQAEQYRANNSHLNSELDSVKAVFNEKEKELALAVAKVEQLTRQLKELRNGAVISLLSGKNQSAAALELERLKKELLIRNKLNEEQNNTIAAKENVLREQKGKVVSMDNRIQELQQRLKKRKLQEDQNNQALKQANKSNAKHNKAENQPEFGSKEAKGMYGTDPYIQYAPQDVAKDDSYTRSGSFTKKDPKYQTLPSNVKLTQAPTTTSGNAISRLQPNELNNNNEGLEEYKLPTVLPMNPNTFTSGNNNNQKLPNQQPLKSPRFNNNDFSKPNQNFMPQPTSRQGVRDKSNTVFQGVSKPNFPNHSNDPPDHRKVPLPEPLSGRGDHGGSSSHPVISINEEERQAGSGQSSPASSEGSDSSGGIQIRDGNEENINTASIGSVSAMIEKLNKGKIKNTQTTKNEDAFGANIPPSSQFGANQNLDRGHSNRTGPDYQNLQAGSSNRQAVNSSSSQNQNSGLRLDQSQGVQPDATGLRGPPVSTSQPFQPGTGNISHPSTQTPQLNLKPAPTYRYASKNQIANTYMGRLGGAAMERYQQNLNKLYKNLESSQKETESTSGESSADVTRSSQPSTVSEGVPGQEHFGSVSPHDYPDIASDKGSYKLNTPKQVRRRHSDSENEDLNKALQERQNYEQQTGLEQNKTNNKSKPTPQQDGKPVPSSSSSSSSQSNANDNEKNKQRIVEEKEKEKVPESKMSSNENGNAGKGAPTSPLSKVEVVRRTKSNLKKENGRRSTNRVSFDPLALLLDASLEGELDLVKKVAVQVDDVSTPNDEGITALHNAICAGHFEIVKFLIEFGCDVNSPDSDGWTPLHCAASCNNLPMVRFLVEHGACVFATTISDQETAADKCEEEEDGYDGCSDYLYSTQEKLGITNNGDVYAVFDYRANNNDELCFVIGDKLTVLRKGDESEKEWWWAKLTEKQGYIPRNLLGLYPRVIQQPSEVSEC